MDDSAGVTAVIGDAGDRGRCVAGAVVLPIPPCALSVRAAVGCGGLARGCVAVRVSDNRPRPVPDVADEVMTFVALLPPVGEGSLSTVSPMVDPLLVAESTHGEDAATDAG